jgi:hypothetical protein
MATIRILVLTDDDGSYTKTDRFGLTELVDTLRSTNDPGVTYQVTTAHRLGGQGPAPGWSEAANADIKGFTFTADFDPADYDEVWLFGVANEQSPNQAPLSAAEVEIVARFMQGGGGVFATGDHEDLGAQMCASVPRVRSMRKWTFDYTAVTGSHSYDDYDPTSDNAPPVMGPYRHDTLVSGHDSAYTFDDQSDDIPQTITPRLYVGGSHLIRTFYPHPLLCSPSGRITVLPDHMHEGECVVPDAGALPGLTFTLDGAQQREYPNGWGGVPAPQVIAWGHVTAGHITSVPGFSDSLDPAVAAADFGVIAAYDGQLAGVGRVVTGSTFHHYFNINLIGTANTTDPLKKLGFPATASGQAAYARIKTYYRNLARWLAPAPLQAQVWVHALTRMTDDPELRMSLPIRYLDRLGWADQVRFGWTVRSALNRIFGACTTFEVIAVAIDPLWLLVPRLALAKSLPDPPPWERAGVVVDQEAAVSVAVGAIYEQVLLALDGRRAQPGEVLDVDVRELFERGSRVAVDRIGRGMREQVAATEAFVREIEVSPVG